MVSLRSGSTIEANDTTRPTTSEVTSTRKTRKQAAGASSVSDKKQSRSPKTARRPTKPLRAPSRLQQTIGFLSSKYLLVSCLPFCLSTLAGCLPLWRTTQAASRFVLVLTAWCPTSH